MAGNAARRVPRPPLSLPQRIIRTRKHKLVVNPERVNELYDLQRDPNELVNRVGDQEYAGWNMH